MGLIRAVYCRKGKDESGSARKPEIEFSNAAPSPMSCFFRWEACSSTFTRTECSLDMPRRRLYICMPCRVNQVFFCFLFFQSIPLYERTASRWLALHIQQVPSLYGLVTRKSWKFCACTRYEAYARHFLSCAWLTPGGRARTRGCVFYLLACW